MMGSKKLIRLKCWVVLAVSLLLCGSACGDAASLGCGPRELPQYEAGVKVLMPAFASFGKVEGSRISLLDQSGKRLGCLLVAPAKNYARRDGYRDVINMAVVVTPAGRVAGVVTGNNRESKKFMQRIGRSGFLKKWDGLTLKEAAALKVEAVSRATYSSEAMKAEIQAVLKEACADSKKDK